jgi:hypothetical protein
MRNAWTASNRVTKIGGGAREVLEANPTFEQREIAVRVDFGDRDDEGRIWASLRFMLGPRPPMPGDTVFLADDAGHSCMGLVEDVRGWVARVAPDWETWEGGVEPPLTASASLPVVAEPPLSPA